MNINCDNIMTVAALMRKQQSKTTIWNTEYELIRTMKTKWWLNNETTLKILKRIFWRTFFKKNDLTVKRDWLASNGLSVQNQTFNMRVWSWLRMNAGGVLNTCKSNGKIWLVYFSEYFSGGRVSNTWATCLQDWDNRGKLLLIPDMTTLPHGRGVKGAIHLKMGSRLIS